MENRRKLDLNESLSSYHLTLGLEIAPVTFHSGFFLGVDPSSAPAAASFCLEADAMVEVAAEGFLTGDAGTLLLRLLLLLLDRSHPHFSPPLLLSPP